MLLLVVWEYKIVCLNVNVNKPSDTFNTISYSTKIGVVRLGSQQIKSFEVAIFKVAPNFLFIFGANLHATFSHFLP